MKIAFLSYDFPEYCIRIANGLAREAEVLLLLPGSLAQPHLSKLDGKVRFQSFRKPRLRQPLSQIRTLLSLHYHIRAFRPDVIHVQQGHPWFNLGLPWLRQFPLVLTVHDPRHHVGDRGAHKAPQSIMDFGYRQADQLITHGHPLKQVLVEECNIPSEKIDVIPHVRIGEERTTPTYDDGASILFFGRVWGYKGLEYLIRAEPLITSRVPAAKITIAGTGEDFARYREMMVHPDHFIVRNEYISEQECTELFDRTSIVVLPYIEASQSGVIPLAYTAGKPVVATKVGGLPEMVEHGRTGFLVTPRDEKALADAIVCLLESKELRREFGLNGRRKIDAECSPDIIAEKTLSVYLRLLESPRSLEAAIVKRCRSDSE
jgi:glycosyltransferase involved in cell wall biosynthesis